MYVSHLATRHSQERSHGNRNQADGGQGRFRPPRRMRVDDLAPDIVLGEHPDHSGHTPDRGGIGTEVMRDRWS